MKLISMEIIQNKSYNNKGNAAVLKYIEEEGTVLDIGCGAGANARILSNTGRSVTGISISQNELDEARPYLKKAMLFDLEKGLPCELFGQQFKYVICSHVLEHICYPDKLLSDLKNCMVENGRLIVALPNLLHYSSRWKLLKGEFEYQDCGIWDNTHFRWYTYSSGKKLLESHGFRIVHQTVTGHLPGYSFLTKILPVTLEKEMYKLVSKLSPGLFGYQIIYVATL